MNRIPTLRSSILRQTNWRPARAIALFLLIMVVTAACGVGSPETGSTGPTKLPATGGSSAIQCLPPSLPSSQGGCFTQDSATDISLWVTNIYADATSTVVKLQIANSYNYPLAIADPQLLLRDGRALYGVGGYLSGSDALLVDEPVPPSDFGQRVTFVATSGVAGEEYTGNHPPTFPPAPPWLNEIGTVFLSVPFAISPVRSGGYSYNQAPVIKHGIGVQVQSLEYSSAHPVFYGTAGGASIELRFSGLPADLELLSFIRLEANQSFGAGEEGNYGPGQVDLKIPGMSVSTPAFTVLDNPLWPSNNQGPSVGPTVGASGAVKVEVSYQGAGKPNGKPATLSISRIQFLTGGIDGSSGNPPVLPSYQITLPMS